ncbi:MAG: glycerate kinase [Acidobacteria bacterium]|nr:glycerate kinase [Acidobacteriota bacterium]
MKAQRALLNDALHLFNYALTKVAGGNLIRERVRREGDFLYINDLSLNLRNYQRIVVAGAGKCVAAMGETLEKILPEYIDSGIIVVKEGHTLPLCRIEVIEGGHPYPNAQSLEAGKRIFRLAEKLGEKDLLLFLLSGGASSLLTLPAPSISFAEKVKTTELLLKSGAKIREINTVRKHISAIKGGNLAKTAYPASVISLILSDVIGGRFEDIGSGPTAPDSTTYNQAKEVLINYGIWDEVPSSIRQRIEQGIAGEAEETPKMDDPALSRTTNILIGDNRRALYAIEEEGKRKGYNTILLTSSLEGEAKEIAKVFSGIAREIKEKEKPVPPPALVISGGETTVKVRGKGKGGRNMELALSFLIETEDIMKEIVFLSGGTDGSDGPTEAAGAIVDYAVIERMRRMNIDPREYLLRNDSYTFFKETGGLLITGPTNTNVMDIQLLLVERKE